MVFKNNIVYSFICSIILVIVENKILRRVFMLKKIFTFIMFCLLLSTASFADSESIISKPFDMFDGNVYVTEAFELTSSDYWLSYKGYDLGSYYNISYQTRSWNGPAVLTVEQQKLVNGKWITITEKSEAFKNFETGTISRDIFDLNNAAFETAMYRLKLTSEGEKINIYRFILNK